MADVLGVTRASTRAGSTVSRTGSMSAKTGVMPAQADESQQELTNQQGSAQDRTDQVDGFHGCTPRIYVAAVPFARIGLRNRGQSLAA